MIALVYILSFGIHLIGTMTNSVRLVTVQTQHPSIAWALYGFINFFARIAITFQAPLLAKHIEHQILLGQTHDISVFRNAIWVSVAGTLVGALLIPTATGLWEKATQLLYKSGSVVGFLRRALKWKHILVLLQSFRMPHVVDWQYLLEWRELPLKIILLHLLNHSFWSISVLTCLLAGYLQPELRATAVSMNGVINGIATFFLMLFVDPDMAILTDKVLHGEQSYKYFEKYFTYVILCRIVGIVLGQLLLLPLAHLVLLLAAM